MLLYIGKILFFMIPLLLRITIICFGVMHLAPGSPTDMQTQMNPRASVEAQERLRAMYDLISLLSAVLDLAEESRRL